MDNESPARGRAPRLRGGRPRGEAQGHRALTEQEWVAHYGETVLPASEVNLRTPDGQALALLITARLIATGRLGWLRAQQILKAIALARDATRVAQAESELRKRRELLEHLIRQRQGAEDEWSDAVDSST